MTTNQSKPPFYTTNAGLFLIFLLLIVLATIVVKIKEFEQKEKPTKVSKSPPVLKESALRINQDSLDQEKWDNLEREIVNFDITNYDGEPFTPMNGVGQLQEYSERVKNALESKDSSLIVRAKRWQKQLSNLHSKAYPQFRRSWGKAVGEKLWRDDIEVRVLGGSAKTIEFTGGTFAANRNIEDFQTELQLALLDMRFTRVQYRWYKGATEYTYYKLDSKNDSEL